MASPVNRFDFLGALVLATSVQLPAEFVQVSAASVHVSKAISSRCRGAAWHVTKTTSDPDAK